MELLNIGDIARTESMCSYMSYMFIFSCFCCSPSGFALSMCNSSFCQSLSALVIDQVVLGIKPHLLRDLFEKGQ